MSRRSSIVLGLIAICVLLAVAGCNSKKGSQDRTGSQEVTVSTTKATVSQLTNGTTISGKLEALESANVVPKMAGKVASINVDIGSEVRAGDVLVALEAKELAASVSQAQAAVSVVSSSRELAQSDYDVAKTNYERGKALLEQGAISQSDYDNKFALPFKKAEEYAARGVSAQLSQAQAALQLAQANYSNSIITSPISGIVTAKNINLGELAGTSFPVVTVVNLDKVVVQANVSEERINDLKEGAIVQVKVSAASDRPFEGTITNIAFAANSTTKAFPIKIQIDNPGHILKPGMFAEVMLNKDSASTLTVPREAVVSGGDKNYVWVLNDGTVTKKEVMIGSTDGIKVSILSGLTEGQEIVLSAQDSLQEDMGVLVQPK